MTATLTREQALDDLDRLEGEIEQRYAYLSLRRAQLKAALDRARDDLPATISLDALAIRVMAVLASLADGHSALHHAERYLPRQFAPCLFGDVGDRIVAFPEDRRAFLHDPCPFVIALDGQPIEAWLTASRTIVPAGPAQLTRRLAARTLRHVGFLRAALGLPSAATLEIECASADGHQKHHLHVPIVDRKPRYDAWRRPPPAALPPGVGLWSVARMDDGPTAAATWATEMSRASACKALVLDLRGNSGGHRDLIPTLLGWLMPPGAAPTVVNAALYRLRRAEQADAPEGHLADRQLFPAASARWSAAERAAIATFAARFRPQWLPEGGSFSAWPYMLVSGHDDPRQHFSGPVIVLVDAGCFSATEILLTALQGRPNLTLVGQASGGGSGRPRSFSLRNSDLRVALSTMASYRADGTLIQGRGIAPDVALPVSAEDWIGRTDDTLAAALALL